MPDMADRPFKYEEAIESLRAKQRRELDRCLANLDEAGIELTSACDTCVDEIKARLDGLDLPQHVRDGLAAWLADHVRNPIDTIAEEKRRSIKILRAMIATVEAFDPPPARVPLDD